MLREITDDRQVQIIKLRRDVIAVLVLKAAIILLAAFFVFGAAQRLHVDDVVMTTHIMR